MESNIAHYIDHQNFSGQPQEQHFPFLTIDALANAPVVNFLDTITTLTCEHLLFGRPYSRTKLYTNVLSYSYNESTDYLYFLNNQLTEIISNKVTRDTNTSPLTDQLTPSPYLLFEITSVKSPSIFRGPDYLRLPLCYMQKMLSITSTLPDPVYNSDRLSYFNKSGYLPNNFIIVNKHSNGIDVCIVDFPFIVPDAPDYGPLPDVFTDYMVSYLINPYTLYLDMKKDRLTVTVLDNISFYLVNDTLPNQLSTVLPGTQSVNTIYSSAPTGFAGRFLHMLKMPPMPQDPTQRYYQSFMRKDANKLFVKYVIRYNEIEITYYLDNNEEVYDNRTVDIPEGSLVRIDTFCSRLQTGHNRFSTHLVVSRPDNSYTYTIVDRNVFSNTAPKLLGLSSACTFLWRSTIDAPNYRPSEFTIRLSKDNYTGLNDLRTSMQVYTTYVVDQSVYEANPTAQPVNVTSDLNLSISKLVRNMLKIGPDELRLLPKDFNFDRIRSAVAAVDNIQRELDTRLSTTALRALMSEVITEEVTPTLDLILERLDRLPTISPINKYNLLEKSYLFDYFNPYFPTQLSQHHVPFIVKNVDNVRSLVANGILIYFTSINNVDPKRHTIILDPNQTTIISLDNDTIFPGYSLDLSKYVESLCNIVYFSVKNINLIYLKFDAIIPASLPYVVYSLESSFNIV